MPYDSPIINVVELGVPVPDVWMKVPNLSVRGTLRSIDPTKG
jgi:hypothetical protein